MSKILHLQFLKPCGCHVPVPDKNQVAEPHHSQMETSGQQDPSQETQSDRRETWGIVNYI